MFHLIFPLSSQSTWRDATTSQSHEHNKVISGSHSSLVLTSAPLHTLPLLRSNYTDQYLPLPQSGVRIGRMRKKKQSETTPASFFPRDPITVFKGERVRQWKHNYLPAKSRVILSRASVRRQLRAKRAAIFSPKTLERLRRVRQVWMENPPQLYRVQAVSLFHLTGWYYTWVSMATANSARLRNKKN